MTFTTMQKLALYEIGREGRKTASKLSYMLASAMKEKNEFEASGEMLDLATYLTLKISDSQYDEIFQYVYKEVDAYYRCRKCKGHYSCPHVKDLGGADVSE